MRVKTRIFEFCSREYKNLPELARAMEVSVSQIYCVREGKRRINQQFIVGAIKAFPNNKLGQLFYLVPESPCMPSAKVGHFGGNAYREHSAFLKAQHISESL